MNSAIRTGVLLTALTLILIYAGGALAGQQGVIIAFIFACVMNVGAYWFSDRIVLGMYRAQPVTEADAPELFGIVRELAGRAGLPMPKVYVIPNESPNAFATGRDPRHAAVAVTRGILRLLDREELRGVLAHELGHVQNRDILIMSVAATLAGAVSMLASMARWALIFGGRTRDRGAGNTAVMLAMMIVAPIAAMLVQMAISRSREFPADAQGARIAGSSGGLAAALEKLEAGTSRAPMDAPPATAHLFIVNPLRGGGITKLFSTHPPVSERVRRLRAMAV